MIAGAGLVGLYLMKKQPGDPFSLGGMFRTLMPNSPTQAQRAAMFAAQSGRRPDSTGTSGYGSTSVQPAYAGLLPGLGSFATALFTKIAGPGNAAPSARPQASASSGGGVSQPTPGMGSGGDILDQSQVFFGDFDNSYSDFAWGAPTNFVTSETIASDQGTYDVLSGEWY